MHTNPLALLKADRYFLTYRRNTEVNKDDPNKMISITASKLVCSIFKIAKNPIRITVLYENLKTDIPSLDKKKLLGIIRKLLSQQFLLSSILPSLLSPSPFKDLLPKISSLIEIEKIARAIESYNHLSLGKGEELLQQLQTNLKNLAPSKNFIQVDCG